MTTITIYRKDGIWMAFTHGFHLPEMLRRSPVFDKDDDHLWRSYTEVMREVQRCNPGCNVIISKE
jgi:hypothetical protein